MYSLVYTFFLPHLSQVLHLFITPVLDTFLTTPTDHIAAAKQLLTAVTVMCLTIEHQLPLNKNLLKLCKGLLLQKDKATQAILGLEMMLAHFQS